MTLQEPARHFVTPLDVAPPPSPPDIGGSARFWRAKRIFDVGLSLALVPLLLAVAALLWLANPMFNPGPVVFRQTRMGRHCAPFRLWKFRTMRPGRASAPRGVEDPVETHRITPLGRLLRQLRIDELPQIINVLRGEMSLIGPRPDIYDHATVFARVIPHYRARNTIRPGISGWAQVTLGYAEGLEATHRKAAADLAYLRAAGPWLEIRIVWRTLVTILRRNGA